jgi:hypothetical protein
MATPSLMNGRPEHPPQLLTLRVGVAVLAGHGKATRAELLQVAEGFTAGAKRPTVARLADALRPLVADGVLRRDTDGNVHAPSIVDLAAWVADGYGYREDAGRSLVPGTDRQARAA